MYGSVALADSYFALNDLTGKWASYNSTEKTAALNRATTLIDRLQFRGMRYLHDQEHEFPRVILGNIAIFLDMDDDGNVVVPEKIEQATFEQAKFLLDNRGNQVIEKIRSGVTSISIGSTTESYNTNFLPINPKTQICQECEEILKQFLLVGW